MSRFFLITTSIILLSFYSCKKALYSVIPTIEQLKLSKQTLQSNNPKDSLLISFYVYDGDADLGVDRNSGSYDIYMDESRTIQNLRFYFPEINGAIPGAGKGIEGLCNVYITGKQLKIDSTDYPKSADTLYLKVYVVDKAGHKSNTLFTNPIYLK
ncbi:MAG: hypothetical protein KGN97_00795 [Bacteroidota bacterium]|jgi:hypothetical protein|nr:hypothetical protein [Bacteroidota bacterium]